MQSRAALSALAVLVALAGCRETSPGEIVGTGGSKGTGGRAGTGGGGMMMAGTGGSGTGGSGTGGSGTGDRFGASDTEAARPGDPEPRSIPEPPFIRRTGSFLYLRLRRHDYDDAALDAWASRVEPFINAGDASEKRLTSRWLVVFEERYGNPHGGRRRQGTIFGGGW